MWRQPELQQILFSSIAVLHTKAKVNVKSQYNFIYSYGVHLAEQVS